MNTHTPGPWRIASFEKRPSLCLRVWSGEVEVCQINHWGNPERDLTRDPKPTGQAEANARLIAAAPDLLAACQAYVRARNDGGISMADLASIADGLIRAAISKANPQS